MKRIFSFLFSIVFFSSCVTTKVSHFEKQGEQKVALFVSKSPEKQYDEIAYIEAVDTSPFHGSKEHLLRKLKEKALHEGADAIVDIKFSYVYILIIPFPTVEGIAIKYK